MGQPRKRRLSRVLEDMKNRGKNSEKNQERKIGKDRRDWRILVTQFASKITDGLWSLTYKNCNVPQVQRSFLSSHTPRGGVGAIPRTAGQLSSLLLSV